MTEKDVIAMLESACHSGDTEADHAQADGVLTTFLLKKGYTDLVAAYAAVEPKYF